MSYNIVKADHRKIRQFWVRSTTGYHIEVTSSYVYRNYWIIRLECEETGNTDYCQYIAEYGRGLEEVGLGPSKKDIATISQMLGEMVQEFCTDRMLVLDDEYQRDYRVATVDEAMSSLSAMDSGKIIVDDSVVCFVQF